MTPPASERIAIVGGTGHLGLGLARRLSRSGASVLIGSRERSRAETAASAAALDAGAARTNADAARDAGVIFLTVPFEAHEDTLRSLAPFLEGKVLVDTTVSYDRQARAVVLVDGVSAAERAQRLLPHTRVVAGLHTVSAHLLAEVDRPLPGDVLLCGDDADAKSRVSLIIRAVMRPVDAGVLRNARVLEELAGLLLGMNRRYKKHDLGIAIVGLE